MADETPAKFTPSKTLFYIKAVNQEAIEITNVKNWRSYFLTIKRSGVLHDEKRPN